MIGMERREFSQKEWNDIVSSFRDLSLMQTWEYAEAKATGTPWKIERAIFCDGTGVVGAVQAMVRYIPLLRKGLVWVSRGPLWRGKRDADASVLVAMLAELRRYWTVERGMYLRVLPTLFQGEVDPYLLTGVGYSLAEGSGVWVSSLVDLSQPVEVLRSRLQQKWRNCLNKAERQAIVAESGSDRVFTEVLLEYKQMLGKKGFASVVTPDLLTRLQCSLPENRKLWGLIGRQDNRTLGGILIARYGQTSEYLVGAVNDAGKAANAGQYLLWRAICEMKEMGYRWFDMGGMDPLRTRKGILHFKQGVNGSPYELIGELESFDGGLLSRAVRWRVGRARQLN